jgi:hypothetical protein
VIKDTTICFCSRVMLRISPMYGAIGVSVILCANVVIILHCLGFGCKGTNNLKNKQNKQAKIWA